ncbi:MAG: hypothetical protein HDS64_08785 [Bacteroidales bacterium]|nr:hypothetical protein [Bacteroidales bacterium]
MERRIPIRRHDKPHTTGPRGALATVAHQRHTLWKGGFRSAATTNRIQPGPVAPSPRWRISATPYGKADSDPPPRHTKLPDDIAKLMI